MCFNNLHFTIKVVLKRPGGNSVHNMENIAIVIRLAYGVNEQFFFFFFLTWEITSNIFLPIPAFASNEKTDFLCNRMNQHLDKRVG